MTTEPTCEGTGVRTYTASYDDHTDTKTETLSALGHAYGELVEAVEADCEHGGNIAYYHCENCGKYFDENKNEITEEQVFTEAIGVAGDPVKLTSGNISADMIGKKVYLMTEGGGVGVALGQSNNTSTDSSLFTEFTITAIGSEKVTIVSPDGYYLTKSYGTIAFGNGTAQAIEIDGTGTLNAGSDVYPYLLIYDSGKISVESMVSLDAEYLCMYLLAMPGHNYGLLIPSTATCEEGGTAAHYECSICHKIFDENKNETTLEALAVPALGHEYGELVEAVEAGCEHGGNIAYYHCESCGKYFDENKNEIPEEQVFTEAIGVAGDPVKLTSGNISADMIGKKVYLMTEGGGVGVALGQSNNTSTDSSLFTEFTITAIGSEKVTIVSPDGYYLTKSYGTIAFGNGTAQAIEIDGTGTLNAGSDVYPYLLIYDSGKISVESMVSLDAEYLCMYLLAMPGHNYGLLIPSTATCEEGGTAAHYECSICHKIFDENKNETTLEALAVPALGHAYGELIPENYDGNGLKAHYECSVCHKLFDEDLNETTADALRLQASESDPNIDVSNLGENGLIIRYDGYVINEENHAFVSSENEPYVLSGTLSGGQGIVIDGSGKLDYSLHSGNAAYYVTFDGLNVYSQGNPVSIACAMGYEVDVYINVVNPSVLSVDYTPAIFCSVYEGGYINVYITTSDPSYFIWNTAGLYESDLINCDADTAGVNVYIDGVLFGADGQPAGGGQGGQGGEQQIVDVGFDVGRITADMVPDNFDHPSEDLFPGFVPYSIDEVSSWHAATNDRFYLLCGFNDQGFYVVKFENGSSGVSHFDTDATNANLLEMIGSGTVFYYTVESSGNGGQAAGLVMVTPETLPNNDEYPTAELFVGFVEVSLEDALEMNVPGGTSYLICRIDDGWLYLCSFQNGVCSLYELVSCQLTNANIIESIGQGYNFYYYSSGSQGGNQQGGDQQNVDIGRITAEMVPDNSDHPSGDLFPGFVPYSFEKVSSWHAAINEEFYLLYDFDDQGFYLVKFENGSCVQPEGYHDTDTTNAHLLEMIGSGMLFFYTVESNGNGGQGGEQQNMDVGFDVGRITADMLPDNSDHPSGDIFPGFVPYSFEEVSSWRASTNDHFYLIYAFGDEGFYVASFESGRCIAEELIYDTNTTNSMFREMIEDGLPFFYTVESSGNGGQAAGLVMVTPETLPNNDEYPTAELFVGFVEVSLEDALEMNVPGGTSYLICRIDDGWLYLCSFQNGVCSLYELVSCQLTNANIIESIGQGYNFYYFSSGSQGGQGSQTGIGKGDVFYVGETYDFGEAKFFQDNNGGTIMLEGIQTIDSYLIIDNSGCFKVIDDFGNSKFWNVTKDLSIDPPTSFTIMYGSGTSSDPFLIVLGYESNQSSQSGYKMDDVFIIGETYDFGSGTYFVDNNNGTLRLAGVETLMGFTIMEGYAYFEFLNEYYESDCLNVSWNDGNEPPTSFTIIDGNGTQDNPFYIVLSYQQNQGGGQGGDQQELDETLYMSADNGKITLYADGYTFGDMTNTGYSSDSTRYEIFGSGSGDSPLVIDTRTAQGESAASKVTFYLTFDNLSLTAEDWASALVVYNFCDVVIYITNIGTTSIEAYNHPAFSIQGDYGCTVDIFVTSENGFSGFECGRRDGDYPSLYNGDDFPVHFEMNGTQVDENGNVI